MSEKKRLPPQEEHKAEMEHAEEQKTPEADIKAEYKALVKECKDELIPELLHANTLKLPKVVFLEITKISLAAFKALGMALLICPKCEKIRYGANIALIGDVSQSKAVEFLCRSCILTTEGFKEELVVYAPNYDVAGKLWKGKKVQIVYGYAKPIEPSYFLPTGRSLHFKML